MAVEIITREDLYLFRVQLLEDFKKLLGQTSPTEEQRWLKGSEVRRLLSISPSTLQSLRISGKLKSTKIGGVHYYSYSLLKELLEQKT